MTTINGKTLLRAAPIKNMVQDKQRFEGASYGLGEAGYDIRLKQSVRWVKEPNKMPWELKQMGDKVCEYLCRHSLYVDDKFIGFNRFTIASGIEEFQMPQHLVAKVADKSTHARRALSVFNTVIEPGWNGFLTLELVYHGEDELYLPAGVGIAQTLYNLLQEKGDYADGKYQGQADKPIEAIV